VRLHRFSRVRGRLLVDPFESTDRKRSLLELRGDGMSEHYTRNTESA